jgi:hypothetical protein
VDEDDEKGKNVNGRDVRRGKEMRAEEVNEKRCRVMLVKREVIRLYGT